MHYPAQFEAAPEGGFVVTFRDIPEAITQGETEAEAMEMAADALLTASWIYRSTLDEPRRTKSASAQHSMATRPPAAARTMSFCESQTSPWVPR